MTPTEQAAALIEEYLPLVTTWDCHNDTERDEKLILRDAKKCAIIAVDRLIDVAQDDSHFLHTEFSQTHFKYKTYWRLVKNAVLETSEVNC